jgi:thioredoxin reductase (NADPH)
MSEQSIPAIIIGGGIGGVSCAIELQYNGLDHLLLDDQSELGGQLPLIKTKIRNLGGLFFTDGASLQRQAIEYIQAQGIRFKANARVRACDLYEKSVETDAGVYRADSLVIATGARLRLLEADYDPGLEEKIVYFTERQEADFAGKHVVLVGGGDYGSITALDLAKAGANVTLIHRSSQFTGRSDLLELVKQQANIELVANKKLLAVRGDNRIQSIEIEDTITGKKANLATDAIVAKIGCVPNSELFSKQLPLTEDGYIQVDARLETAIPGVFAIGDVTAFRYLRISTALGQGAAAAMGVMSYLLDHARQKSLT